MNKEDYFKYYIQGSDHYLIPRDIFEELFDEMSNWREEVKESKEKYLNAVADYETTMFEKEQLNSLVNSCQEEIRRLKKQNDSLKQKLNWIAFGDDSELALRYLREIGYVDFDEERKVYINKHNNEPFLLKDEQEKDYYIKDNELNEYTEQLYYQIKELKRQLEEYKEQVSKGLYNICLPYKNGYDKAIKYKENQQKEFIEYMHKTIEELECDDVDDEEMKGYLIQRIDTFKEILSKYKEIIGDECE